MGNQPSKEGAGSSKSAGAERGQDGLQSYPSFSRSDTRDSTRSLRGLRSKIPGTSSKTDSPRGSAVLANGDPNGIDKSDVGSTKSGRSARSNSKPRRSDSATSPTSRSSIDTAGVGTPGAGAGADDGPQPPPSPVQSSTIKSGRHDVSAAQACGEVDHVSDQPPSAGAANPGLSAQQPGQSILVRRDASANPAPRHGSTGSAREDAAGAVAMSDIKDIDLDDFIKRLLDAAYAGKVTKSVCLKNAEITAICQRARECFLSPKTQK